VLAETDWAVSDFQIERPKNNYGDYAVNGAFAAAIKTSRPAEEIAAEVANKLDAKRGKEFEKIESKGGYVNFFLSPVYLQNTFGQIVSDQDFGLNRTWGDKLVMVEYTDPNPFKLFHIGHLMSNAIGETIARLFEASGAKVIKANYQGDVGLHVAMAIWAILEDKNKVPESSESLVKKMNFLGEAYATGAKSYHEDQSGEIKRKIESMNNSIYSKEDEEINQLYQQGRQWSLDYFEEIYKRLGTKFDHYFFESEASNEGKRLVAENMRVFEENEGAIIFRGEKYGLHTRVFVNSQGLPTYEAKELGLNKKKFELYPLDLSVIVTGNEITEYFRVLTKVMSLIVPDAGAKTRHLPHGMLRLASGKMSSRLGEVISADSLIEKVKSGLKEKGKRIDKESLAEDTSEAVAIGAIKYSILKQSPGRDIVFDFAKSLSLEGDSGPYLQYTLARLNSILSKKPDKTAVQKFENLVEPLELSTIKHLLEFPDTVATACQRMAPNHLALYLFQLANLANSYYEKTRILGDHNENRLVARLALVESIARVLKRGLEIMGIKTPTKI